MNILLVPLFILVLSIIVVIHEFGHFLLARSFGVTVHEFSVGFGPLLGKKVRNGIQYSLRAIPLGGFVKIAGMDIALEGESPPRPGDRLFWELPLIRRILVILAGPVNNLLLALVTYILVAALIGIPNQFKSDPVIGVVEPKSPAYESGLSPGDRIVEINGTPVDSWEQLTKKIHNSPEQPLTLKMERNGVYFTREVKPFYDPALKAGRIGLLPAYTIRRLPLTEAVKYGFSTTGNGIVGIPVSLYRMIIGKERAGAAGTLGLFAVFDQALKSGLYLFFAMIAGINLFFGFFNLLPIPLPLLDGGWIVIFILERIRKKEFTAEQKATAQIIGLALILTLFVVLTYSDLVSMIRRGLH